MELSTTWIIAIILGSLLVIALSFYAGRLIWLVQKQQQAQNLKEQQKVIGQQTHDIKILNSMLIITKAMREEQCDYSEGCWRLCVLMDSMQTTESLNEQFPAIYDLYNSIKHMPILAERKKLSKQERMKQDMDRMKAEAALFSPISEDLSLLLQYIQEKLSALKTSNSSLK